MITDVVRCLTMCDLPQDLSLLRSTAVIRPHGGLTMGMPSILNAASLREIPGGSPRDEIHV